LALLFVPWKSGIEAPAVLKSKQHIDVFLPEFGARIRRVDVAEGAPVEKGAPLLQLASPDLDAKIDEAKSELSILEWQMGAKGMDAALLARSQVTEELCLNLGDGVNQAANLASSTTSIPSRNLAPLTIFGNWF
jgi:multidrug efflux pump subunit AcrA (membrane-fusion protein)